MKKILLVLFAIIPIVASAQKLEKETIDKFNGIRRTSVSEEKVSIVGGIAQLKVGGFVMIEKDSTKTSSIYFRIRPMDVTSITDKDKAIVKLKDGSVIELPNGAGYEIISSGAFYRFFGIATEDQLRMIIDNPPTDIRITTTEGYMDYEVSEKYSGVIPEICRLLINYN